jgi:hypothetical protein
MMVELIASASSVDGITGFDQRDQLPHICQLFSAPLSAENTHF